MWSTCRSLERIYSQLHSTHWESDNKRQNKNEIRVDTKLKNMDLQIVNFPERGEEVFMQTYANVAPSIRWINNSPARALNRLRSSYIDGTKSDRD